MDGPSQRGDMLSRFRAKVASGKPDECWPWTAGTGVGGYGQFYEKTVDGKPIYRQAHCVAWEIENKRPIQGLGLHTCDNPPCCNPAHVYEGDHLLNTQDAIQRGRTYRGSHPNRNTALGTRQGNAKLDDEAVRLIRSRYAQGGVTQSSLAKEFGVNQTKISSVIRRETWRHV
jgi:hypothetical protein